MLLKIGLYIEPDPVQDIFWAHCPALDLHESAATPEEAIEKLKQHIKTTLDKAQKTGVLVMGHEADIVLDVAICKQD